MFDLTLLNVIDRECWLRLHGPRDRSTKSSCLAILYFRGHVLLKVVETRNTDQIGHNFSLSVVLNRGEKIEKLCGVMGVEWPYDPDDSYELTTDNLKKILAIHMRFR